MDLKNLPKVAEEENSAVVASLTETSTHPFSAIALSPHRQFALISGKDTLQLVRVDALGIKSLRTLKIAQVGKKKSKAFLKIGCSSEERS